MRDLSLMTWKEIKEIDKKKSIIFVVMAPIEEHGHHLPIATDIIEGQYWSRGAMTRLEERLEIECFYLPSFPIASASVNEFYGSIHFSMKTTCDTAFAVVDSICCMGFKNIIVIASHADPEHQIAVEKAVRKVNKKRGLSAIAPMGQIFMGVSVESSEYLRSFEEGHKDDYHAGWIETSSMMDIDAEYVRDGYKEYPDSKITDKDMIFKKKQLAAMGKYGYIGAPRFASKELGIELNENCIESIYDAARKFYERNGYEKYANYLLYKILPLHIGLISGKVRRKKVTG